MYGKPIRIKGKYSWQEEKEKQIAEFLKKGFLSSDGKTLIQSFLYTVDAVFFSIFFLLTGFSLYVFLFFGGNPVSRAFVSFIGGNSVLSLVAFFVVLLGWLPLLALETLGSKKLRKWLMRRIAETYALRITQNKQYFWIPVHFLLFFAAGFSYFVSQIVLNNLFSSSQYEPYALNRFTNIALYGYSVVSNNWEFILGTLLAGISFAAAIISLYDRWLQKADAWGESENLLT